MPEGTQPMDNAPEAAPETPAAPAAAPEAAPETPAAPASPEATPNV